MAAALGAVAAPPAARAGEALFGYVYTTDVVPKGKTEVEQWITDREGQAHGHFHDIKLATEVEHGITDNFQLSGYLNTSYIDASGNSVASLTEGIDIPAGHDPARPYRALRFDGVSAEAIWRVLSPYKDPVGLAFYVEPEVGPRERAIEFRAMLQKNFMDDRLVLAANAWVEFEHENNGWFTPAGGGAPEQEIEKASMAELDLGASYRFRPNWSVGLEYRNHNEFEGYTLSHSHQEHTAHFLGPNIHHGGERWFFTLTALYQLHATPYNDDQRAVIHNGRIYGDEHTRWDGLRLKIGRSFQ